jgi:hypothetical protein
MQRYRFLYAGKHIDISLLMFPFLFYKKWTREFEISGMKIILLIWCFVLTAISNAFAYDIQTGWKDWSKWTACSSDEECVAIHDACGAWTAVNAQFKKEGEKLQNEMAGSVDCLSGSGIEPEPKVLCIDQVCSAKPGGLGNTSTK